MTAGQKNPTLGAPTSLRGRGAWRACHAGQQGPERWEGLETARGPKPPAQLVQLKGPLVHCAFHLLREHTCEKDKTQTSWMA